MTYLFYYQQPGAPIEAFVSSSPASPPPVSPARPQQLVNWLRIKTNQPTVLLQDEASIAALQEYARALAHPISGIPCQVLATYIIAIVNCCRVLSRRKCSLEYEYSLVMCIFVSIIKQSVITGSGAVQWFLTNMENITTIQQAQVVQIITSLLI